MAKAVFITGLVGSGKSYHIRRLKQEHDYQVCDDGFLHLPDQVRNLRWLIDHLQQGHDCLIGERSFMVAKNRDNMERFIAQAVPGTTVEWLFTENDPAKAEINIRRDGIKRNVEAALAQIRDDTCHYDIPSGATVFPIVTDWPDSDPHASAV